MNKKVGLITMHRVANHGSVLQALATQKAIEQLGHSCTIIDYAYPTDEHLKRIGIDWYPHERDLWQLIKKTIRRRSSRSIYKRLEDFYRFRKRFLTTTKRTYYSYEELKQDANNMTFDVYCVGSDQVWNPKYTKGEYAFVLDFVPQDKKKISYSSSFVVHQIEDKTTREFYAYHLNLFNELSVRESSGVDVLKDLIGREATHVLDPVFLLPKEQWIKLLGIKEKKQPYVLFYSLNYMADTLHEMKDCLEHVMRNDDNLTLVVSNRRINTLHDLKIFDDDKTKQFVEYIANASLVLTDSFHASAFAMIFGVPVYGFVGDNNDDRLISLYQSLGFNEYINPRCIADGFLLHQIPSNSSDNISQQRSKALQYLKKAIE